MKNFTQSILDATIKKYQGPGFDLIFYDGVKKHYGASGSSFSITIKNPQTLKKIIRDPIMGFGEAYTIGDIEVSGDLRDVVRVGGKLRDSFADWSKIEKRYLGWLGKIRPRNIADQQKDIAHHYDLGNDFFSLWLDKTMTYSCAYFKRDSDTLEEAQQNKNDYVLKKVLLKKGETLLDIGSGWGDLIILAAKKYGAKAIGITLAKEQEKRTLERIKQEGLQGKVQVHYLDYRQLASLKLTFDKIVSVGMFEHVGKANIHKFIETVKQVLAPQGIMLLHTIGRIETAPINPWIQKYIFPGGYLPTLQEILDQLALADFCLLDIENLRLHYGKTLDFWAQNYDRHYDQVAAKYGAAFARMWRLYLFGAAASFRYLGAQVYQIVFTNGLRNDLPLTRSHLYN